MRRLGSCGRGGGAGEMYFRDSGFEESKKVSGSSEGETVPQTLRPDSDNQSRRPYKRVSAPATYLLTVFRPPQGPSSRAKKRGGRRAHDAEGGAVRAGTCA